MLSRSLRWLSWYGSTMAVLCCLIGMRHIVGTEKTVNSIVDGFVQEDVCEDGACLVTDIAPDATQALGKQDHQGNGFPGGVLLQVSSQVQGASPHSMSLSTTGNLNASVDNPGAGTHGHQGNGAGIPSAIPRPTDIPMSDATAQVLVRGQLTCGKSVFAPDGQCPLNCPYFTQDKGKNRGCYFKCVKAVQCSGTHDIADPYLNICRKCMVLGCKTCAVGQGDTCAICAGGYHLKNGACESVYWFVWQSFFVIITLLVVGLACWMITLACADVTNHEGLQEGLAFRNSLKFRVPKPLTSDLVAPSQTQIHRRISLSYHGCMPRLNEAVPRQLREQITALATAAERPLWPAFATNLHSLMIAGPGLILHFNFQMAIIIWGCILAVIWVFYSHFTYPEMFTLGLTLGDTPRDLCVVTLKGEKDQLKIMKFKVLYMILMLLLYFVFNFVYAVCQRRKFLALNDDSTMSDFAAICTGLPQVPGDEHIEEQVKTFLEDVTGEDIIGVSVCWDYKRRAREVYSALERDVEMLETRSKALPQHSIALAHDEALTVRRQVFGWVDKLFGFSGDLPEVPEDAETNAKVLDMIKTMNSTDTAFVVFASEESRDCALQAFEESDDVSFRGHRLSLTREDFEADTVLWENFADTTLHFLFRMFCGFLAIFIAMMVWCFGIFASAHKRATYAEQGREPSFGARGTFILLVVIGNQSLRFICKVFREQVGFTNQEKAEVFYIFIYTSACFLLLCGDMAIEAVMSYEAFTNLGVQTADGKSLLTLTDGFEILKSYPMQRALGMRLWAYCFPSTFLMPYILEPLFFIVIPFNLSKLLLGTHPEVRGLHAEKAMDFHIVQHMGRYGDILLNLMLLFLVVFFPPGTFLKMILVFVVSHSYIYLYDHYRVLRCSPIFNYPSNYIDREMQILMGIPASVLAAGIVFKVSCLKKEFIGDSFLLQRTPFICTMLITAVAAFGIHIWLIKVLAPRFDTKPKPHLTSYEQVAAVQSSNWFSENPMFCLRSKHVYQHQPACCYNATGKSHLIEPNPDIGIFYREMETPLKTASAPPTPRKSQMFKDASRISVVEPSSPRTPKGSRVVLSEQEPENENDRRDFEL